MCNKLFHHQVPECGQRKSNMSEVPVNHHSGFLPAKSRCFHVWSDITFKAPKTKGKRNMRVPAECVWSSPGSLFSTAP